MTTLKEQLDSASTIYLQLINNPKDGASIFRYSAYTLSTNGELAVLWPDYTPTEGEDTATYQRKFEKAARAQGFTAQDRNRELPRYHFAQRGYGYSKSCEVLHTIQRMAGRRIPGFLLTGHSPSPISNLADSKLDGDNAISLEA